MLKKLPWFMLLLVAQVSYSQLQKPNQQASVVEAQYKSELYQKIKVKNYQVSENQKKFDVYYYDLNIDLDTVMKRLYGQVTMSATVVDGPIEKAELDLLNNMKVDSVLFNNTQLSFSHDNDILQINLPQALENGASFSVTVYYRGTPRSSGLGSFSFSEYAGKPMIWTLSEPFGARNWWPGKDAPIDKADSVDIKVTVPSEMIVASNGNLRQVTEANNRKTYWWHEGYPIATYLVSLAIYEYDVMYDWYVYGENDSMPLQYYSFPNIADAVKGVNLQTKEMIKYFSDTFGQYPFINEKYGHASFLWPGAMEHQTMTSMGAYYEDIVVHELAHQWFGDMITNEDFHHIWLNEGFATYCETLWFEFKNGIEGRKYARNQTRYYGPGTIYVEDPGKDDIFSGPLSYNKASWVLHMLRFYMGDETFFEFLRTYYQRYQYSTINTEQFRDLAEEVSGLDLHTFFQQWIYEEGNPFYEYLWFSEEQPDGTYRINGIISQVQDWPTIFELPIEINVHFADGDTAIRVFNDSKFQEFDFVVNRKPVELKLDEEEWLLRQLRPITTPVLKAEIISVSDSSGNKNGEFEPGEEIELLLEVSNFGLPARDIVGTLKTIDPEVTIITSQVSFGTLNLGESVANLEDPFVLSAAANVTSHIAKLVLEMKTSAGYSTEIPLNLNLGQANILLVDDDAGEDYEQYVQQFAVDAGILTKTWDLARSAGLELSELQKYQAVVWFTGDDRTSSLTANEQALIAAYMSGGGKLFLSGQNIGFDLVEEGTPEDTTFFSSVLHAQYIADSGEETMIIGNRKDAFFRTLVMYLEGEQGGAHNQNSRDVIAPVGTAQIALNYIPSFKVAGIMYEDETTGARLFYSSFGIEGIAGPAPLSASQFIDKVVTWLLGRTAVEKEAIASLPTEFVLRQNYPNPFNPSTTVQYSLPQSAFVEATIFNTLGRVVKKLYNGQAEAGRHTVTWDGSNKSAMQVASGLYIMSVSIKQEDGTQQIRTIKMVKLQ